MNKWLILILIFFIALFGIFFLLKSPTKKGESKEVGSCIIHYFLTYRNLKKEGVIEVSSNLTWSDVIESIGMFEIDSKVPVVFGDYYVNCFWMDCGRWEVKFNGTSVNWDDKCKNGTLEIVYIS